MAPSSSLEGRRFFTRCEKFQGEKRGQCLAVGLGVLVILLEWVSGAWAQYSGVDITVSAPNGLEVSCIELSPDARLLLSCQGSAARLWSANDGYLIREFRDDSDQLKWARFSGDGKLVLSHSEHGGVLFWDPENGKLVRTLGLPEAAYRGPLTLSPDERTIIGFLGLYQGPQVWDLGNGKLLARMEDKETPILTPSSVTVSGRSKSPSLNQIFVANDQTAVAIWTIMDGKQLINWKDGDWINGVAVSADGKYIASVHSTPKFSGKIEVRYTDSGKAIFAGETDHSENVVAFSPDGLRILTGTNDGSIESWSRDGSRHTLINRNEDQAKISTIVFSKDGKVYVSGDETGVLNIWDAEF